MRRTSYHLANVVVSTIFYFHPCLFEEMIQFDKHIFQMGWNHQLECDVTDLFSLNHLWLLKNHQIQSSSMIPNLWKWLEITKHPIFNWLFGVPLGDIFPYQKIALSLEDFYGADAARGLFPSLREAALIAFGGGETWWFRVYEIWSLLMANQSTPPTYLEDHPRFITVTTRIIACLVIAVNLHLTLVLAGGQTQDICTNTCTMYILYISIAPETCKRRGSLWDLDWQKTYLFGRLPGTFW